MYEVIVLGATFTAAGIAGKLGKNCLILESRPDAGYEFFGAFHFGTGYDKKLYSEEAVLLREKFKEQHAFGEVYTENNQRVSLFECMPLLYQHLEKIPLLLNTQIVNIKKDGDEFLCLTHSISGYQTFRAKKIIDTRVTSNQCISKTYNMLIDGTGEIPSMENVQSEPWGLSRQYVLRCSVPLSADYSQARQTILPIIRSLPKEHKLLLLADVFDYTTKKGYPNMEKEIIYHPSKMYDNPLMAYDAGVCFVQGGLYKL